MKKTFALVLLLLTINVYAKESEITNNCQITINGKSYDKLTDTKYATYNTFDKKDIIDIKCEENIKYLYIYYDKKPTKGLVNGKEKLGQNNYLHELIKLDGKNNSLTLTYHDSYSISEIFLFNDEELPSWVEDWQTLDKADLMLFSSHADDEQLFFAGLMPTYIDKGYKIQVVYFTNHFNNTNRYHEQLEGLWAIGIKYYPVISIFPDAYAESLDGAINNLKKSGYNTDDALLFEVNQLRKFKPFVVVGHDEKGEYGHGQHILNTYILKDAIIKADDKSYDVESDNKYVVWLISKLYLHLYDQNKIVLNYDIPLESYNGKTAYEISKLGYAKHYSQQYTWFTAWLNGDNNEYTKATDIKTYNPAYYGLYYSSVGEDTEKNDMFENIVIKEPDINIIDTTKNIINKFTKDIDKNDYKKYIGIGLMIVAILGLTTVVSRKKH